MTNARSRRPQQTPTVTVQLFWNDRAKAWDIRAERVQAPHIGDVTLVRAESTAEMDHAALWLLVNTIKSEVESWLM